MFPSNVSASKTTPAVQVSQTAVQGTAVPSTTAETNQKMASAVAVRAPIRPMASSTAFVKAVQVVMPLKAQDKLMLLHQQMMTQIQLHEKHNPTANFYYILSDAKLLNRSIYRSEDGTVFVLFNKAKDGDKLIWKGNKIVKLAINVHTLVWMVSSSMTPEVARDEENARKLLGDIPGVLTPSYTIKYISKGKSKVRTLAPRLYPLSKLLVTKTSPERKYNLILQIFRFVINLHAKNLVHRDLNPTNVLVDENGICFFHDLESVCKLTDSKSLKSRKTTMTYASAEYITAVVAYAYATNPVGRTNLGAQTVWANSDFSSVNTKALDIWSVGLTAYQILFNLPAPPWIYCDANNNQKMTFFGQPIDELNIANAANTILTRLKNLWQYSGAPTKNPIDELVKRALDLRPTKRITAEELEKELAKL